MPAALDVLVDAALAGDRRSLARLLSVVESGGEVARQVAERVHGCGSDPATVGLTGPPGAGKSTLCDALIARARARGRRIALLAVDPSSPRSGGALLGDRVRLRGEHTLDGDVFVRSLASRRQAGGLAAAVPDAVRLLGAAGWPTVLVETVGVGQGEMDVAAQADTTVVVLNPDAGDEVQANKAGLLEVADVLVVNKIDLPGAARTVADLRRRIRSEPTDEGWDVPVVAVSATGGQGTDELWSVLDDHARWSAQSGTLGRRRAARRAAEVDRRLIAEAVGAARRVLDDPVGRDVLAAVADGRLDPATATARLTARLRRPAAGSPPWPPDPTERE